MANKMLRNLRNLLVTSDYVRTNFVRCASYRAAVLTEFGKSLKIQQLENVKAAENQVTVSVKYCSLNQYDVRLAEENTKIKLPFVLGREFSGKVLDTGGAEDLKLGDNVVVVTDKLQCGGLAEEAVVAHSQVWPLPSELSISEAAVVPVSYGTAFLTFSQYCELEENDLVIISAGPAGLGLAAVDVASTLYKAKVVVVYDAEGSSDLAREKGAHHTVQLTNNPKKLYKDLSELLKGKKAKVVYDAIGGNLLHILADFVDPENGKMFCAHDSYDVAKFIAARPDIPLKTENVETRIQHVDFNHLRTSYHELYRQIIDESLILAAERSIVGHVSKVFPLARINDAFDFIKNKQCTGKVLIDMQAKEAEEAAPHGDSDDEGEKAKKGN